MLTDNTIYYTETSGTEFIGADSIIEKIKYVQENRSDEYHAYLATITDVDDTLEYSEGTRCIVLAAGEEDNYESIAFINVNNDGMIERIKISTDSRYHFRIDDRVKIPSPLDDIKIPDSVVEPILLRAKFNGIIDEDYDENMVAEEAAGKYSFENNAQRMLNALADKPQPDAKAVFENIFGYLFAKSIEMVYNDEYAAEVNGGLTAEYSPDDAFRGVISSTLDSEKHAALEKALELGKQFYSDFSAYMQFNGLGEDRFAENIKLALVTVQWLGEKYMYKCFGKKSD